MSAPTPLEQQMLAPAAAQLDEASGSDHKARLDVLEAVASLLGGFSLDAFRASDEHQRVLSTKAALMAADAVLPLLDAAPVPPALALTSLARPPMLRAERRRAGAYYTDFRLARFLARGLANPHRPDAQIIDPASGTGILLVAAALEVRDAGGDVSRFIGESVHAADLSAEALRGVRLALASLTDNDDAIGTLTPRLRVLDSLKAGPAAWADVAPRGFQNVIGNPPWEKLKVTRHELLISQGVERDYGTEYDQLDAAALEEARNRMSVYVTELAGLYGLDGGGEQDLFRLFLGLSLNLAADDGHVGILVPAGLIRSQGTEALRTYLLDHARNLRMTVLDNKARFFAIDTRFKFLAVQATLDRAQAQRTTLVIEHATPDAEEVAVAGSASIERADLKRLRPDLTVPEVRSDIEWDLYRRMAAAGARLGELRDRWPLDIVREVDMTNDRRDLSRERQDNALPVVEGRMIHQFRSTHKSYVSGSGRSAAWSVAPLGNAEMAPQFWMDASRLTESLRARAMTDRVGFCDITGQTNERAMLAARVPAGAVCGNKVPTITFARHPSPADAADLWLAIANSFAFDWLLRRLVTTTVNFFLLRNVPFPDVEVDSKDGRRLIELARLVDAGYRDASTGGPRQLAEWRAEMDALVFRAYGLGVADAALVMQDFPLLDRGQLPLPGDKRSTVTRDLVLDRLARLNGDDGRSAKRLADALLLGATAYIPAELARAKTRTIA